ncbi:MAG: FAD-dependent oxidoreductase [Chitinophagia bacterium]|nr:FAD-dependent oxidoreductase [Chitinophagia bacterium]
MLPQWQKGIVTRIEQATHNTRRYWVQVPALQEVAFTPGQFVTLDLPIHEQRNKRWRSYSIANAPDGTNTFELVIVHNGNGTGSRYIFEHFTEGSEVTFRGPQGTFVFPASPEGELYLICTGTGIAPFRSMVQHIARHQLPHPTIHLIYGCRRSADLLYFEEMQRLQEQVEGFHYHYTFSRELTDGHNGYVHPIYERLCQNRPAAQFMICGWREMIDEARDRILTMGYPSKNIFIEIYG